MPEKKRQIPDRGRPNRRLKVRWRLVVLAAIVGWLVYFDDYRPDAIGLATAPYRFSAVTWEFGNLPDKWLRRIWDGPMILLKGKNHDRRMADVAEYFALGMRLREIDRDLIRLASQEFPPPKTGREVSLLRNEQTRLRARQSHLRPGVEETVESAIADTLKSLGFQAWTGVFPPVDTVLTGSPTVLVTSPRDRIARLDDVILRTGLTNQQRERIETGVESETGLSALVVNTGGIAFYPSITLPDAGLDFALEVVAHEWVHQWLWFRPLGKRYFEGGDMTAINETVANIAGHEIAELTLSRLKGTAPEQITYPGRAHTESQHDVAADPSAFDFQEEMRTTRVKVDELLASGDVDAAEKYMEERRREFVQNGYLLRRLNQAYFAFHGTYATTGAAGVSVVGQQVVELRRRSPTLEHFLRAAAEITRPEDLANVLAGPTP